LWFFGAVRSAKTALQETFRGTGVPYTRTDDNTRYEVKLTGSLSPNHTLQGSYLNNKTDQTRPSFTWSIDPAAIVNRNLPNNRWVVSYNGVLSSNLFAEVKYSQKKFGFRGTGGTSTEITDSPFITRTISPRGHYNAPYFDSTDPEDRDNKQITGNLSYFLSTASAGSHDIKGGVEWYQSTGVGGNSQSSTDYVFYADYVQDANGDPVLDANGRLTPNFVPGARTLGLQWIPTRGATIDITTTSFFINDRWAANEHWSFNLGARYERVRSEATGGIVGVDTDTIVPRLAASYDVLGDGQYRFDATYAHYAGKYSESQFANNSPVGNPELLLGLYVGAPGQGVDFAPGFDFSNYFIVDGDFPTANIFFADGLHSPVIREWTLQAGTKLTDKGYLKLAYINRKTTGFIEDFTNLSTGETTIEREGQTFGPFSNVVYENSDEPDRKYQGLQLQANYRLNDAWTLAGHYTLQLKNEGNFEGEATNQPGISSVIGDFPEMRSMERHYPIGRLNDFQRHKVRLWTTYDLSLGQAGTLGLGLLYRYNSPLSFSLVANGVDLSSVQQQLISEYASAPSGQSLYFVGRGTELYEAVHLVDLALTYDIKVVKSLRPYVKFELRNMFNAHPLESFNTTVNPDPNSSLDSLGLPTGYIEGTNFGEATSRDDYPIAREFRWAVGFRF
jgi:outer membrane receptor protein involved in Fe transport